MARPTIGDNKPRPTIGGIRLVSRHPFVGDSDFSEVVQMEWRDNIHNIVPYLASRVQNEFPSGTLDDRQLSRLVQFVDMLPQDGWLISRDSLISYLRTGGKKPAVKEWRW